MNDARAIQFGVAVLTPGSAGDPLGRLEHVPAHPLHARAPVVGAHDDLAGPVVGPGRVVRIRALWKGGGREDHEDGKGTLRESIGGSNIAAAQKLPRACTVRH